LRTSSSVKPIPLKTSHFCDLSFHFFAPQQVLHDAALLRSLSSVGLALTGEHLHVEELADGAEELVGFGSSVLLAKNNETRLVVGAPLYGNGGAVFVYDYDGSSWGSPVTTILGAIGDRIGDRMSLSADGSRLAVRFKTFVRIFHLDTTDIPHDIPGGGATVSLSYDGSLVALSAEGFNSWTGRVFLYSQQADGGNYTQVLNDGVPLAFVGPQALGRFGWATSFNEQGDRLAISAPYHGSGGRLNLGLVRVFEKLGESWIQLGQDEELLGTQVDEGFGLSIALSANGDHLVVGSPGSHVGGNQRGKVSVFKWESGAWTKLGDDIPGEEDTDRFGRSVAISSDGSRVAATSYAHADNQGLVVLFNFIGDEWYWTDEIEGEVSDHFLGFGLQGLSMTSDGLHIAAGAFRAIDDDGLRTGEVSVYEYHDEPQYVPPTSTPSLAPTISVAPSPAPSTSAAPTSPKPYLYEVVNNISDEDTISKGSSQFGFAVALSNDGKRLVLGAPKLVTSNATNTTDGGIFMYELVGEDYWNLTWSLTGNENEKLGNRLSLTANGSRLAIRRHDPKSIEIYNISATGNALIAGIITQEDRGDTVTLSPDGTFLAVSHEYDDSGRGLVSVYYDVEGSASNWTLVFSHKLNDTNAQTRYGWATAFSESADRLAISAPNYNGNGTKIGLVHIFYRNATTWSLQETFTGTQDLEQFGFSMSLSSDGSTLVTGSPGSNGEGTLQGQLSTYQFDGDEWQPIDVVSGIVDNDRVGRNVALSNNGTRLAATSLFHDALSGQVLLYDLVGGDKWVFVDEREGYLPGDRLGFGVTALATSGDGSRLVTASLATNGTDVAAVRTFDVIDPDDEDYDPSYTPPEFDISGCVCNTVRVCLSGAVVPGSVIRLCLNTGTDNVTFVGINSLALVEQDVSKFTYRAIHEGKFEFGTSVDVDGSAAFIEAPLMTFFSGSFDVVAYGLALLRYNGSDRYVKSRILVDNALSSGFDVYVKVEKPGEVSQPTSSAISLAVSWVWTMTLLLLGLAFVVV